MTRDDVGDRNVERLLGRANAPEDPTPEFRARLKARLLAEATPSRDPWRPWALAGWAVAAAALTAAVLPYALPEAPPEAAHTSPSRAPERERGDAVTPPAPETDDDPAPQSPERERGGTPTPPAPETDDSPTPPAPETDDDPAPQSPERERGGTPTPPAPEPGPQPPAPGPALAQGPPISPGLRPRPLPAAPPLPLAELGATLTTGPRERRVVRLPCGSRLFLDVATRVAVTGERRVRLEQGEVYLEVAPRPAGAEGATFHVATPSRELSALGTRLAVRATATATRLLVTQGAVAVSGVAEAVAAGQVLEATDAAVSRRPARRPRRPWPGRATSGPR